MFPAAAGLPCALGSVLPVPWPLSCVAGHAPYLYRYGVRSTLAVHAQRICNYLITFVSSFQSGFPSPCVVIPLGSVFRLLCRREL